MDKTFQLFKFSILVMLAVIEMIAMDNTIGERIMLLVASTSVFAMVVILLMPEKRNGYEGGVPAELQHQRHVKQKHSRRKKRSTRKKSRIKEFELFLEDYMKKNKRKV